MGPLVLLKGVREVSKVANPDDPVGVSQRAFDKARPQAGRYHDLPTARNIATALRVPWRGILEIAHGPEGQYALRLEARRHTGEKAWLTDEYIGFVLKLVARRMGATTISEEQYLIQCREMLREDSARWLHGGQLLLPTGNQLKAAAGTWRNALALAGLVPRKPIPIPPKPGAAPVELLERFYAIHGTQPTKNGLRLWAKANGIRYTQPSKAKGAWSKHVAEWKAKREAEGLPVPDGIPPPEERPDYTSDVGASLPGDYKKPRWHDIDECIAWIAEFLGELRDGETATMTRYNEWASEGPGRTPLYSEERRMHGGWRVLMQRAQERRLEQQESGG